MRFIPALMTLALVAGGLAPQAFAGAEEDVAGITAGCQKNGADLGLNGAQCKCYASHLRANLPPEQLALVALAQKGNDAEIAKLTQGKPLEWSLSAAALASETARNIKSGKLACPS